MKMTELASCLQFIVDGVETDGLLEIVRPDDEVDEHAEQWQEQHEEQPQELAECTDVGAHEDVDHRVDPRDRQRDEDEQDEEEVPECHGD